VPHARPFIVNITGSPPPTLTGPLITVAVTIEVDTPSVVTLDGLATSVTVSDTGGWLSRYHAPESNSIGSYLSGAYHLGW
jgi:hypothetical protein